MSLFPFWRGEGGGNYFPGAWELHATIAVPIIIPGDILLLYVQVFGVCVGVHNVCQLPFLLMLFSEYTF